MYITKKMNEALLLKHKGKVDINQFHPLLSRGDKNDVLVKDVYPDYRLGARGKRAGLASSMYDVRTMQYLGRKIPSTNLPFKPYEYEHLYPPGMHGYHAEPFLNNELDEKYNIKFDKIHEVKEEQLTEKLLQKGMQIQGSGVNGAFIENEDKNSAGQIWGYQKTKRQTSQLVQLNTANNIADFNGENNNSGIYQGGLNRFAVLEKFMKEQEKMNRPKLDDPYKELAH